MSCRHAQRRLLPDLAAGEIAGDARHGVELHVGGCDDCRAELTRLRATVSLLARTPAAYDPPAELRTKVLTGVVAPSRPLSPSRRRPGLRTAAALVVAALAVGGVVAFWPGGSHEATFALRGPTGSGTMSFASARDGNSLLDLRVSRLPREGAGEVYQVWLGTYDRRLAIGAFRTRAGSASVRLPVSAAALGRYRWLWVTRERDDGDPRPSKLVALRGSLPRID